MIRVGIVDDESSNRADLLNHLARYAEENAAEIATEEFEDGSGLVQHYRPRFDVLLMDVEMPGMDGFEASRRIRLIDSEVVIIFVTNMAQYAIKGYEVDALSYLVKPVPYFAFAQEFARSLRRLRRPSTDTVTITSGGQLVRIQTSDIVYCESDRHRITVHTLHGKYLFNGTLKALEEELAGRPFFRSNHGYLVNLHHVTGVDAQSCTMTTGETLQVSRPRKKDFMRALTDFVGRS